MLEAIKENDMEKLQKALEKGNPNSILGIPWIEQYFIEWYRVTPLQKACELGNFEMVKLLVENGADVNYYPPNAWANALFFAADCDSPEKFEMIRYLIKNGAVAEHPYPISQFLADWKSAPDEMEILRELVAVGARVDDGDFWRACYMQAEEAIRFFIEEIDLDYTDPYLIRCYCASMDNYSYETLEALMKKGANPYAKADNGKNAMDYLREKNPDQEEKLAELAKKYGYKE